MGPQNDVANFLTESLLALCDITRYYLHKRMFLWAMLFCRAISTENRSKGWTCLACVDC